MIQPDQVLGALEQSWRDIAAWKKTLLPCEDCGERTASSCSVFGIAKASPFLSGPRQ